MARTTKQTKDSLPSAVGKSIATKPAKQIPNTNRRQMDQATTRRSKIAGTGSVLQNGMGNTKLKVTTCYGDKDGTPNYDDIKEAGVSYRHPDEFQTTVDKSDRVPQWNAVGGFDLADKNAHNSMPNTHVDKVGAVGFHKQPMTHVHSLADTATISQGGVLDQNKFTPSYEQSGFGYYS